VPISVECECGQLFETPEWNAGRQVRCPDCARELLVPKPPPPSDVLFDSWESESRGTSGKAIASLSLGFLFFFACLSGLPAILLGRQALRDISLSKGRLRGRNMAIAGIVLGGIGCLFTIALIMPATRSAREAGRRSQCINNLKQIGLAFENYHSAYGSLPAAAITDENGRPLLSWRVAILPYLESNTLYSKFHLDEPWDSPHNLSLLGAMPHVYTCPSDSTLKPGMTGYQVVIGSSTAFTPDFKPVTFPEITDGLSRTVVVGESRQSVPWTKPEDVRFDMAISLTGLGSHHGYHNNGFNVLFADGVVRFVSSPIAPSTLRAIITRNGNETNFSPND
jgi:prepilin-type processing-associated H-X9-DG protein